MNSLNGKNVFRKFVSKVEEMASDNNPKYRKGLNERLSAPLRGNNLERIPGHDMLSFE